MKMVELLVRYDMAKVYSGEISPQSTDMITDIHVASDDELTPSERRQFETELSDLIHKHFISNRRRLEQELSLRQYNVKELYTFCKDGPDAQSEDDFYHRLSFGSKDFAAKLKSGEVETVSRNYLLTTGLVGEYMLEQFDACLKSIKARHWVEQESISTSALRHVLINVLGLSEQECFIIFRSNFYYLRETTVGHYNRLIPLSEITHSLARLNHPYADLVAMLVEYTKDNLNKDLS